MSRPIFPSPPPPCLFPLPFLASFPSVRTILTHTHTPSSFFLPLLSPDLVLFPFISLLPPLSTNDYPSRGFSVTLTSSFLSANLNPLTTLDVAFVLLSLLTVCCCFSLHSSIRWPCLLGGSKQLPWQHHGVFVVRSSFFVFAVVTFKHLLPETTK
ncbi:hypothetical protein F5H01DRAFT_357824 [Linnemannia elongata]|nr:hypothetical protein F5H01DRAFT_357824 [Linnemannia elongata]